MKLPAETPDYYQQALTQMPEGWYEKRDWWQPSVLVFMLSTVSCMCIALTDLDAGIGYWEASVAVAIAYLMLTYLDKKSTAEFIELAPDIEYYDLPRAMETHAVVNGQISQDALLKLLKFEIGMFSVSVLYPPLGLAMITGKWATLLNNRHLKNRYELAIHLANAEAQQKDEEEEELYS